MGLRQSKDNDELVDNLVTSCHIKSKDVEKVFRLVDRGRFIPEKYRLDAYTDTPFKIPENDPEWRDRGILHLSAPSMYGAAVEKLSFEPGNSFLNIGSGSGWLNTVAGFLIGDNGTNHGIEIHENLIKYSNDRLEETLERPEIIAFPWSKPTFFHGNGLAQKPIEPLRGYDRIYCGAAVGSERSIHKLIRLLNIGGKLVAPYRQELRCFMRTGEFRFIYVSTMPVHFADLVPPKPEDNSEILPLGDRNLSLKWLCRTLVRQAIRRKVLEYKKLQVRIFEEEAQNRPDRRIGNLILVSGDDEHQDIDINDANMRRNLIAAAFEDEDNHDHQVVVGYLPPDDNGEPPARRLNDAGSDAEWSDDDAAGNNPRRPLGRGVGGRLARAVAFQVRNFAQHVDDLERGRQRLLDLVHAINADPDDYQDEEVDEESEDEAEEPAPGGRAGEPEGHFDREALQLVIAYDRVGNMLFRNDEDADDDDDEDLPNIPFVPPARPMRQDDEDSDSDIDIEALRAAVHGRNARFPRLAAQVRHRNARYVIRRRRRAEEDSTDEDARQHENGDSVDDERKRARLEKEEQMEPMVTQQGSLEEFVVEFKKIVESMPIPRHLMNYLLRS